MLGPGEEIPTPRTRMRATGPAEGAARQRAVRAQPGCARTEGQCTTDTPAEALYVCVCVCARALAYVCMCRRMSRTSDACARGVCVCTRAVFCLSTRVRVCSIRAICVRVRSYQCVLYIHVVRVLRVCAHTLELGPHTSTRPM